MPPPSLPAGLMLIHGNQPERLREVLVQWMKRYPLAPLENEVILVQSNGIAQWLRLALAADPAADGAGGGCGIAAALTLSLPARFLWQVYRAVLGPEAVPQTSPLDRSRLVWRLMRLLPELLGQPVYAPLRQFLAHDTDRRKRFQLAERLADLFDQYQVYRADWLAAWADGADVWIDARDRRAPLPDAQRWQSSLWRALLTDLDHEAAGKAAVAGAGDTAVAGAGMAAVARAGRAAVHAAFLKRAAEWPADSRPPGLPRRVMVFGVSSLPRQSLEVLAGLARWTQVLMAVHNPCQHYWRDIVAGKDLLRARHSRQTPRPGLPADLSDDQMHRHAHPLLAAWGKQGRDFIGLLDEVDSNELRAAYQPQLAAIGQRIDLFDSPGRHSLLHQLQDDILELRPIHESRTEWPAVDPATDTSIRFHLAHSPQREVEILHDLLLDAFNRDPSLQPRDIIVMVPDIAVYAASVQAVFGLTDPSDRRHIPFSLADREQRQHDPLIHAIETLLALPQSRIAVSEVLDLLQVPALRRRFGISETDLPLLQRWIRGANIRWGLHARQRASLDLPENTHDAAPNTWHFGLRRMLLGYAIGNPGEPWHDIDAYDEIAGLDAAALGPLAQLIERLDQTWQALREPATVAHWCERLRRLMADFFDADDSHDAYTLQRLGGVLQQWLDTCDEAALTEALPLSVVAEHWLAQFEAPGLSQRFFGGSVTFATLMPMRAIPFRQVCLLGMNDGDYPRARAPMDFDLMALEHRPGDRSRREDDRYLFLEALLSAREHLLISWVARSIRDNTDRPPSVLVAQLREHLAAGWGLGDDPASPGPTGAALLAAITVAHPLQPFSTAYFSAERAEAALFTYAHEWRQAGADALPGAPAVSRLVPLVRHEPITLRELSAFLHDPVKTFFHQRLKVVFDTADPGADDSEPFALDGLQTWQLQDELIRAQDAALRSALASGAPPPGDDPAVTATLTAAGAAQLASIQRRGDLAEGGFGIAMARSLQSPLDELFARYRSALDRWPTVLSDEIEIRFQTEISGQTLDLCDWLGAIRIDAQGARGRVILESSDLVVDRKYRADKVVRYWVTHLAAQLAGAPLTTLLIGKKGSIELSPMRPEQAQAHLRTLLAAWCEGQCRPLPLAIKTAFEWLRERGSAAVSASASDADEDEDDETSDFIAPKTKSAARSRYEGDAYAKGRATGELTHNPYLQRAWPSFDALTASGEFGELAESLLRPILAALPARATGAKDPA